MSGTSTEEIFYTIRSSDYYEFKLSSLALKQSITLTNLVEDCEITKNDPIPVENYDGATLDIIFQWCERHKGEPIPTEEELARITFVPAWEREQLLAPFNIKQLYCLNCASRGLVVKKLEEYCCILFFDKSEGKVPATC